MEGVSPGVAAASRRSHGREGVRRPARADTLPALGLLSPVRVRGLPRHLPPLRLCRRHDGARVGLGGAGPWAMSAAAPASQMRWPASPSAWGWVTGRLALPGDGAWWFGRAALHLRTWGCSWVRRVPGPARCPPDSGGADLGLFMLGRCALFPRQECVRLVRGVRGLQEHVRGELGGLTGPGTCLPARGLRQGRSWAPTPSAPVRARDLLRVFPFLHTWRSA